jgi:hypothetical protein
MSEWTDDMAACVASCKTEEKIENGRLGRHKNADSCERPR